MLGNIQQMLILYEDVLLVNDEKLTFLKDITIFLKGIQANFSLMVILFSLRIKWINYMTDVSLYRIKWRILG